MWVLAIFMPIYLPVLPYELLLLAIQYILLKRHTALSDHLLQDWLSNKQYNRFMHLFNENRFPLITILMTIV